MKRTILAAVVVLVGVPAWATAQEAVTLKLPSPAKGDVQRVHFCGQQLVRMLSLDALGNDINERSGTVGTLVIYTDEFLDVDKDRATRFRRHFDALTETVNDADPVKLPWHGLTAVVDQREGKCHISADGGDQLPGLLADQLEALLKTTRDKMAMLTAFNPLPDRPVKVGDSWNIDVTELIRACETKHNCKMNGATAVGTLREVSPGPKGRRAKVEVNIRIPLTRISANGRELELNADSGTSLESILEFALDGDSFSASNSRFHFLAAGTGPEADGTSTRMRVESTVDLRENRAAKN
jgi:hypothetical protein